MFKLLPKLNPSAMKASRLFSVLLCICGLLSLGSLRAQDGPDSDSGDGGGNKDAGLEIGIRTGVNYGKFILSGAENATERRVGYTVAGVVGYRFNQWLAVDAEVGFAQYAAGRMPYASNFEGGSQGMKDVTLNNIESNLLLDVKLPLVSVYKPRFYAGPSFTVNANATTRVEGNSNINGMPLIYRSNETSQYRGFELGAIVGAGLDFDLKVGTLKFDARYRRGLTNFANKNFNYANGGINNRTVHTDNLGFTVAFMIGL